MLISYLISRKCRKTKRVLVLHTSVFRESKWYAAGNERFRQDSLIFIVKNANILAIISVYSLITEESDGSEVRG